MKKIVLVQTLALFAFCSCGYSAAPAATPKTGDYKGMRTNAIPRNAYGVFSYDDALKDATKKKKPLAFLVIDDRKEEPEAKVLDAKIFWGLEDDTLVVVMRRKTSGEWKRIPESLAAALNSPDLGKDYPRLLVTTEDGAVLLAGLTNSVLSGLDEKALKNLGKELKKAGSTKAPLAGYPPPGVAGAKITATPPGTTVKPAEKPDAPPAAPGSTTDAASGPLLIKNAKSEVWTNTEGKTIQAALIEVNGETVIFEMGGKKVPYDISKLSEPSKKRVEELKAGGAK